MKLGLLLLTKLLKQCNRVYDISSGSVHCFLLQQYMQCNVQIATSWHLLIILSTSSLSSFKNLLNVLIVFPAKPRVEISRRIKLNCARGVMSGLHRLLYLLALNSGDLLKLVSNGQVSSMMVIQRFFCLDIGNTFLCLVCLVNYFRWPSG